MDNAAHHIGAQAWPRIFDRAGEMRLGPSPDALYPGRDMIYTGSIPKTMSSFGKTGHSRTSGNVICLPDTPGIDQAIDFIRALACATFLARSGYGRLQAPSYWVRLPGGTHVRPAIALSHLSEATGLDMSRVRVLVGTLAQDGAIVPVSPEGRERAIVLCRNVVNDAPFRHYLIQ